MFTSEMKKYGKIGTDEITIASPIYAKIALLPNGYTEMHEEKPDEPGCWVINDTGGWDMTIDRNMISEKRKQAYLNKWPVVKQMEALVDAVNGDNSKLLQLNKDFKQIKESLPYMN